jgi:cytochrome P450
MTPDAPGAMTPEVAPPSPIGTPEFIDDPYPTYAWLRDRRPAFDDHLGAWVVTRFDDVSTVLADPRLSSTGRVHALLQRAMPDRYEETRWIGDHFDRTLPFLSPPRHTLIRALLMKALTPRMVESLRPGVQELTDGYLDAAPDGPFDICASLTLPLPMAVISLLLGVPMSDSGLFIGWTADVFSVFSPAREVPRVIDRVARGLNGAREYLADLVTQRRRSLGTDLVSLMITLRNEEGRSLTDEDIVANCLTMYTAGHETTQGLLGNGLLAILSSPVAADVVRTQPGAIRSVIEEALRYDSPLQRGWRVATDAVELNGATIAAGDLVAFFLGAANRDSGRFADPERFDPVRTPNRHLAFGYGPHFCIGAGLARMEAEVVFASVLRRYPHIALEGRAPERRRDITFRVLDSLWVAA